MKVRLKLFAHARDIAGTDAVELELNDGATVADLRRELCDRYQAMEPISTSLLIAIDNDYAGDDTPLVHNAELACFPPVSGG